MKKSFLCSLTKVVVTAVGGKPGAADTPILEIVGKALVNHVSAHWPQRSAVSFVLGGSKIDLLIAGTSLVLGK